jgi:hypothetical protein
MVSLAYLSVWFLYRVWKLDRFRCLSPERFRQGELKSVVTGLIFIMIPFQLYYGKRRLGRETGKHGNSKWLTHFIDS